jgi:hypothetical protein
MSTGILESSGVKGLIQWTEFIRKDRLENEIEI